MGVPTANSASQGLRGRLLLGASVAAFAAALSAHPASAQTAAALRGAAQAAAAAATPASRPATPPNPAMAAAAARALRYQARAAQGIDLATQAQQAAREAAKALASSIPDGLGVGGLDPVANPVSAANDPTGLHTWDGAAAPTQTTTSDGVQVTVTQTQARAVLDWQTFNVGRDTTLVFDQKQNGVAQPGWVALNRVVGQIDPHTGLRDPNSAPAPSQILGHIKADGTVLVLNQNGVLFGPTAQVDVHSLVATSLEIGRAVDFTLHQPLSIAQRNAEFLDFGLLGFADQASVDQRASAFTFSAQAVDALNYDPTLEGAVTVQAGAEINSGDGGFILLTGPRVVNSGKLSSPDGQVSLQSGRQITLQRSTGAANGADPNVRGFVIQSLNRADAAGNYVRNTAEGLIEAERGYVSLAASDNGAVIEEGALAATTSVSRNGFIRLSGGDIRVAPGATLSITPDDDGTTIPQDPVSLDAFKPSKISIGGGASRIEIGADAMIYAPGADIGIGADPGPTTLPDAQAPGSSRIFIDDGAVIDAAGLTDVLIPASRNALLIRPVKKNELRDTPNYKDGFLNGASVYVDPRLSGVRADGVAWVGSPLIEAESYYQQVGVTAAELMTKGGNVTLGVASASGPGAAPDVIVKPGAAIDISGGWVRYEAGQIQTSRLVDASGQVVDIGDADPNGTYVGLYTGYTQVEPRWGTSRTWTNPLLSGAGYAGEYTEGRDAGSLTVKASALALDGSVYGDAFAGARQLFDAKVGTRASGIYGDLRKLQAAPSQLPSGGFLFVQALGVDANGAVTGGGDVAIVGAGGVQPLASDLAYGQSISIGADGALVVPDRDPASLLPEARLDTISLSADALSGMGLGQLTVRTSGKLTVASDAQVDLAPGGVFDGLAGRAISIDGTISAPSGQIRLETADLGLGSIFLPDTAALGSFDLTVNGTLSTRGRWINDFGADSGQIQGGAYINGGSISLTVAPRVSAYQQTATVADTKHGHAPSVNQDISGSILVNDGALLDVSGGGYVRQNGSFDLSGRGGNLSLINQTTYFQLTDDINKAAGGIPGFRVSNIIDGAGSAVIPVNPDRINARVQIAEGTILAHGFAGGGTFRLDTPEFSFGDGPGDTGTALPLDFFSKTGFANYNITSYKTALIANPFSNGLGGYNAVLATQTLEVGAGQTLSLTQTTFSPLLDTGQITALQGLQSGGDLYSVLTPTVAADAWDRKAVNLTLGGLLELHVAQGGAVEGEAGGVLTVSELFNEGRIRIAGGTILQSEILPTLYAGADTVAVSDLSQTFSTGPDGSVRESARNAAGVGSKTNAQLAAQNPIYLLGDLDAGEGVRLAAGSVTDLSGTSLVNPRARTGGRGVEAPIRDGRVVAGGRLESLPGLQTNAAMFHTSIGPSVYTSHDPTGVRASRTIDAEAGAVIDVSGAADAFDRITADGYAATPVWSDGGMLMLGGGGTLTGADIRAGGGAPQALGGSLVMLDPTLYQVDPDAPTLNAISASMIGQAGFDTFQALGSLSSSGDVTLNLRRGFFLSSRPYGGTPGQDISVASNRDAFAPVVRSGGRLEIEAAYIGFDSNFQTLSNPAAGVAGTNSAIFRADAIDIQGAVLFDRSIASLSLEAKGDLRLIGVQPWELTYGVGDQTTANSLAGRLAANGDISITAAQVYPTTGSSVSITSSAANGTISFARSSTADPATPYSAGGSLLVQAANIVQGGVLRAPIGHLTLGSDTALNGFAPATQSVRLTDGSITSVSADGLVIPYGTTTDQIEWFFAPTGGDKLTAPPAAILDIGGAEVALDAGADIDLSGGGDLYAYEFISGTGGSHDVLDRFNTDAFSADNGLQYPDGRQVYAIAPGLSDAAVAAYDPIYSSDYGDLYSASGAGKRVYLSAAPGLAAGWYTLLPAKYALLPGAMRVVEDTGAKGVLPGDSGMLKDGSLVVSGYYGVAGTDARDSTVHSFVVQPQGVFRKYSNIALTYANATFAAGAAHAGTAVPRLPVDAGRLILDPLRALSIDATPSTAPGEGGRGAQVDISGQAFDIVSDMASATAADGAIVLTADSLTRLNAASLLIGGVRTDNADGTTSLDVAAQSITVANDAGHPLAGPEILLAVDGSGAAITLADGAAITATGTLDDDRTGDYLVDGQTSGMTGAGALVRVAAGPERLVHRLHTDAGTQPGLLQVGAARLRGGAMLLDSSGDMSVSADADIQASKLALGAAKVTFADDPTGLSGLVITPTLQALFGKAQRLTLRTPGTIDFSAGDYTFGDLSLDTAGLLVRDGGAVRITAGELDLADSGAGEGACQADGPLACGDGDLSIQAREIDFGSGVVRTYGAGTVTLAANGGMFVQGMGGFDAGKADLALKTPFLGDRAAGSGLPSMIPSLAISTTGDVSISKTGALAGAVAGAPGASLSISGHAVSISGSELRATAGTLDITSATGITVADGAKLETPGYARSFGDAADPVSVSAPGGLLRLTALDGDIALGAGTTLSVGGGSGKAGTLDLDAGKGAVSFGGTLDAAAPDGGGSFVLDSGAAFDLATFEQQAGKAFTGLVDIRTGAGDLTLAQGEVLKATDVRLTADGGAVDIAGTIDVSGVEGGDAALFGIDGVSLRSTARIDAHADGYGATDTRQAKAGSVEVGTDGTGAINVEQGAAIDLTARRAGDRLVPMTRNGTVYYSYVPADLGGTLSLRAPVIEQPGADTVRVSFAGTVAGAREIDLEGFKRFDLAAIAADSRFTGVSINADGQAVLNLAATQAGRVNFLADRAAGTLVEFVQDFDVSADYANLGGLAASPVFHARPGMELDHGGDIVLASNWNLGAGSVDVAGAVAAGLMAELPTVPGKYYILPGKTAEVFARFTSLTYRTGGSVAGEPGVLTLRAGGDLDIKGSISDGFFQFRDQTDPDYLNLALGGGDKVYTPYIGPGCLGGSCAKVGDWQAGGALPPAYVIIQIPSSTGLQGLLVDPAPYSAAANSPAALGSLPGGTGDPLGSAELFPLLPGGQVVDSSSYRLIGGADLASADPTRTAPGSTAGVIVEGEKSYSYAATKGTSAFSDSLLLRAGAQAVSADQWLQAFLAANPGLSPDAYTTINFSAAPSPVRDFLKNHAADFFAAYPDQFQLLGSRTSPTGVTTTLALAAKFMADEVAANFPALKANYKAPTPVLASRPTTAVTRTLVRTGTGDIEVAAAGDIDLRNGEPVYRTAAGLTAAPNKGGIQVGGTAIYTAGHVADMGRRVVTDALSGASFTIDPAAYAGVADNLDALGAYRYGAGGAPDGPGIGYTGILVADPVHAEGGGDISLDAGRDVLGRRDAWQTTRLLKYQDGPASAFTWIGTSDQPWRSGAVGAVTDIAINAQLFNEGVGALGGGDISIRAGRDVSDLSVVADSSVATADVTGGAAPTQALWTVGGGAVEIAAGRDLLGGRLDVASGSASVSAAGEIAAAGQTQLDANGTLAANTLRVRLTDATVDLQAGASAEIQGIAALGVQQASSRIQNNLDARGFFSAEAGVSILANGAVTVDNRGADVITPSGPATGNTSSAVYPGSFEAASLTGDLTLVASGAPQTAQGILLYPSPTGSLRLYAGGDIASTTIAMDDGDPGLLPGVFSTFEAQTTAPGVLNGRTFLFPAVLPNTSDTLRAALHNRTPTHAGDPDPVRIYAGGDIDGMILSVPKQARIGAGRDIVDMMFFGQNLVSDDITRITAGRDIIATTRLVRPLVAPPNGFGEPLAALQGNTFVIGGPGSFFLEAGRDAGPFLNSASTDGYAFNFPSSVRTGPLTYGGGVLSVGNAWNPWLAQRGADLYVEFGVGKGADFEGFRDAYLDPANLGQLDGDLFEQVKDATGALVPDRSKPIYAPVLVAWMQANAAFQLQAMFGGTDVTYEQAYEAFKALPALRQRVFILDQVYFNELVQTSIPDGPSYHQYSRGYRAVDTLFSHTLGYTKNDLTGSGEPPDHLVETGDLDLRLATLQTSQGGNISILGPGGRVLAGSTVRTSEQAARRVYDGGGLFAGGVLNAPYPASITSIPVGYEGVLTLAGGYIHAFTDGDFLLNQSRLFTEAGGDVAMWSSNANLNAGQGPKTSANFPPVVVKIDEDGYSTIDAVGGVSGAGIAAFEPAPGAPAPSIYLIAPLGEVDAGDAGVRSSGIIYVAAQTVANANNFSAGGGAFGVPTAAAVDVGAQTGAGAAAAAAQQAAQAVSGSSGRSADDQSIITVNVVGYAGDADKDCEHDGPGGTSTCPPQH